MDTLAGLGAEDINRIVPSVLSLDAAPSVPDDPLALEGFDLHTHPDLVERFEQLDDGLPDGRSIGQYGLARLERGGVIYAFARRTSRIDLRIPSGSSRAEALERGGSPDPELGPNWTSVDAWLTSLDSVTASALLRSWIAASAAMAAAPPAIDDA
jgi:hypothetical protein